jgi:hypothetical protein
MKDGRQNEGSAPRVTFKSERVAVGYWSNVFIVLWRAKPQMEDAAILRHEYADMSVRCREPFVAFVIIPEGVAAPEEGIRREIMGAMDGVLDKIAASLAVMEAAGFVAAATRGALIAMTAFSRTKHPTKFFANATDAVAWASQWTVGRDGRSRAPVVVLQQIGSFRALVG